METFMIRQANADDLHDLIVLYRHFNPGTPELPPGKAPEIWERMQRYPDYRVYMAEGTTGLYGAFSLLIMDNLGHGGAPAGIVENVIVAPEYRGRGVGKRMMEYAMERCREAGCYKLTLSSNMNRLGAHRFYESLGFQKHGYSFLVTPGPAAPGELPESLE